MPMARTRQRVHELRGADVAPQCVVGRRCVEDQDVAAANRGRQGLERVRRGVDDEEMDPARIPRLHHRGRDLGRRRHADPLEGELGLQHARERLRLVEADLRTGKGTLAALEHQTPIARDRLVAGIAGDLDIADGHALRRGRWRLLRECRLRQARNDDATQCSAQVAPPALPRSCRRERELTKRRNSGPPGKTNHR